MVYDGKALTARIRSVSPDGTGVEEKDTKILSGIGKNTNISSIIRYGKKKYKAWYFFKSHSGSLQSFSFIRLLALF